MPPKTRNPLFVGRVKERLAFRQLVEQGDAYYKGVFLQNLGGIGKTWLMKEMLEDARQLPNVIVLPLIDLYSMNSRYIEGITEGIVQRLCSFFERTIFQEYDDALTDLLAKRKEGRQQIWLPASEVNRSLKAVTQALCRCLRRLLAGRKKLVLAFDTVEDAKHTPVEEWLFYGDGAEILKVEGVYCVVAGREFPSAGLPLFIKEVEIHELQDEEIWSLYRLCRPLDFGQPDPTGATRDLSLRQKDLCKKLKEQTKGNPLLLSLAFITPLDVEQIDNMEPDEFERSILHWLFPTLEENPDLAPLPVRQVLVWMAFLSRRFNGDFLHRLIEGKYINLFEMSEDQVWRYIEETQKHPYEMFFVKDRPEDKEHLQGIKGKVQLHDILAEMVRKHHNHEELRLTEDLSETKVRSLMRALPSWYDELIAKAANDEIKYILQAEQVWYLADVDSNKDLRRARGDIL